MTLEILPIDTSCDREIVEQLASELTEKYNMGKNHLTSIKVTINPQFRRANIYVEYMDTGRFPETGREDTTSDLCEEIITWPHFKCSQNTEENWADLSFPKVQMERALMLANELNIKFEYGSYSEKLKCYFEDGKACIDRI